MKDCFPEPANPDTAVSTLIETSTVIDHSHERRPVNPVDVGMLARQHSTAQVKRAKVRDQSLGFDGDHPERE